MRNLRNLFKKFKKLSKKKHQRLVIKTSVSIGIAGLFFVSAFIVWAATLPLPTIEDFNDRAVKQTTKIYDRTGEHLLYDVYENIRRTVVPLETISPHVRNATIAIEDDNFYNHHGVEPTAVVRAVLKNMLALRFEQGGSTLTQQVIKNSVLTKEKTITRKVKEWILAYKLDAVKSKDEILEIYLNEVPYGGSLYGVEAASQAYFNVSASDLSLAQSAYLAALPKAPTYYSPYGSHRDALDARQREVLKAMLDNNFISEKEYTGAINETVEFQPNANTNIQAPHFVMYVREHIAEKYQSENLDAGGFKVVTTLDIDMQNKAQEIVHKYAIENEKVFDAENAGMVVIDTKTGHILAMVGSRDYFDPEIDGNVNITTAKRQPGSAFKPFAYAEAFKKGYTPETVLFDVKTQFSTACEPSNLTHEAPCYSPVNYDGKYNGPISMRNALAQSVNIPAIKTLYLAGLRDTFDFARQMGLETLTNPQAYGLTLVLGGGEVTLLDITGAYGTFANDGIRNPHTPILEITSPEGDIIDEYKNEEMRVLDTQIARLITDVLSDNGARTPAFGANSPLNFPGYDVAAKTGTTNDYRDTWIIGYTPDYAIGAWAGNNDNSPMSKQVAGFIVAPMWNEFTSWMLQQKEPAFFTDPYPDPEWQNLKPILRGQWVGGTPYKIDTTTNKLATPNTPPETTREISMGGIHSILHWVDRTNPRGPIPNNPGNDSQYYSWEYAVQRWVQENNIPVLDNIIEIPTETDDVHDPENAPDISFINPDPQKDYSIDEIIHLSIRNDNESFPLKEVTYFLNNTKIATITSEPFVFAFVPSELGLEILENNTLTAVAKDEVFHEDRATIRLNVSQ